MYRDALNQKEPIRSILNELALFPFKIIAYKIVMPTGPSFEKA